MIWDKGSANEQLGSKVINYDGTFSMEVNVPQGAAAGKHQILGEAECNTERGEAIFTVPSSPSLTLIPPQGKIDTHFTVKGSGYSNCNYNCTGASQSPQVEVMWDTNQVTTAVMGNDGTFSTEVSVPQTAAPGDHQVVGRFGAQSAAATFVVLPPPVLALNPSKGRPGDKFTVTGSGYNLSQCECSEVQVLWDTNEEIGTAEVGPDGKFSAEV
ncbi:MAG TPA: hypothetical protein VFQ77_20250, partial [Pseudonocardiaceae bacterium]|nr:hypothetical protein [Pseudonocardiaceae bacterium]